MWVLGVALLVSFTAWVYTRPTRVPFDASVWAVKSVASVVDLEDEVLGMARDLVETRRLIGLTREQAVELLGERSIASPEARRVAYVVAYGGSIERPTSCSLELRLDAADHVVGALLDGDACR